MSFICKNTANNCDFKDFIILNDKKKISKFNSLKDDLIIIKFDYNKICQYYYYNFNLIKNIVCLDIVKEKLEDIVHINIYESKSKNIINNINELKINYTTIFNKKIEKDIDIYDIIIKENKKKIEFKINTKYVETKYDYLTINYIYNKANDEFISSNQEYEPDHMFNISMIKENIYDYLFKNVKECEIYYTYENPDYSEYRFFV